MAERDLVPRFLATDEPYITRKFSQCKFLSLPLQILDLVIGSPGTESWGLESTTLGYVLADSLSR